MVEKCLFSADVISSLLLDFSDLATGHRMAQKGSISRAFSFLLINAKRGRLVESACVDCRVPL
jgi:hypothetical protein